jgi:hypothetical protein
MISFALPRFCDQSLDRSRKERFYPRLGDGWIAKLDTVIHELYHVDPDRKGIRRIERGDGKYSAHCHGDRFFEQVADMVAEYLDSRPDPAAYDFLRYDFEKLEARFGGLVATSFRNFPSYPQRFIERLTPQPPWDADVATIDVEPLRMPQSRKVYTEADLYVRQFRRDAVRRTPRSASNLAALR